MRKRGFHQLGMGIVEVMIGILIGVIVVLAIYNVFSVAEGYKRTTLSAADAQTTGLFAQFVLSREIANAGNGVSGDGAGLATCTAADANWVAPAGFFAAAGTRAIRPTPVLIRDGGGATQSDTMILAYSTAPRVISGMPLVDKPMAVGTDPFYVQSPNGFGVNDLVIVNDKAGNCELTQVTSVTPGDSAGNVTTGIVRLTHPATNNLYAPSGVTNGPSVTNLGQAGQATRTYFDVVNEQLRTTDLLGAAFPPAGATANPIAQNIVLMKAQYGVDCAGNGVIVWTSATASNICGDGLNYQPDDFMPVAPAASPWTAANLARIHAIRMAVVVRSDEPDLKQPMDPSVASATRAPVVLFNCSANTNTACPGRIVLPAGPVAALGNPTCAPAIICDTWRYRSYETIVPMRNAIFNNGT